MIKAVFELVREQKEMMHRLWAFDSCKTVKSSGKRMKSSGKT
ncbi:hypothetical protein Plano_2346 [Planococcus sp. PAMC 21323]|nr:hypothetical protein Plano_2346 [Planococcus sp. PAMC 21323]